MNIPQTFVPIQQPVAVNPITPVPVEISNSNDNQRRDPEQVLSEITLGEETPLTSLTDTSQDVSQLVIQQPEPSQTTITIPSSRPDEFIYPEPKSNLFKTMFNNDPYQPVDVEKIKENFNIPSPIDVTRNNSTEPLVPAPIMGNLVNLNGGYTLTEDYLNEVREEQKENVENSFGLQDNTNNTTIYIPPLVPNVSTSIFYEPVPLEHNIPLVQQVNDIPDFKGDKSTTIPPPPDISKKK